MKAFAGRSRTGPGPDPTRRLGTWLLVIGLSAWAALPLEPAHALAPAGTPEPAARATVRSSPADGAPILARVGARVISTAGFLAAWREVPHPEGSDSLTPEAARGFLEVLVDRELIAAAASRGTWTWTAEESAGYAGTMDRLVVRAALDSVLTETRSARAAAGDTTSEAQVLGIAARDAVTATLDLRFDRAVLERVAQRFMALPRPSSDSSLAAQLRTLAMVPVVDPADTSAILAHSSEGPFRVGELLAQWARLKPIYRPHIESSAQVEDLVRNGLFERWLRNRARARDLERDPAIQRALARERELIAVQHWMTREVHEPIRVDSIALRRHYQAHLADYQLPERLRLIRMTLPTRADATLLALRLRDPAQAESLVALGRRQGVRYEAEMSARDDSALYERAMAQGVGTVLGPDPDGDAWTVCRVVALLPARTLPYEEVRDAVFDRWYAEQSAGRLRALLERERRRTRVWIDERAFRHLTDS
jgi:hypothetical protein